MLGQRRGATLGAEGWWLTSFADCLLAARQTDGAASKAAADVASQLHWDLRQRDGAARVSEVVLAGKGHAYVCAGSVVGVAMTAAGLAGASVRLAQSGRRGPPDLLMWMSVCWR